MPADPAFKKMTGLRASIVRARRGVTIQAIGHDGWPVAERRVDTRVPMIIEQVADQVRAAVRSESGWLCRVVVLDETGRDVTRRYNVN